MERFKSLFGIRKNIDKRPDSLSEGEAVDQREWPTTQKPHADFIHPMQIELGADQYHAEANREVESKELDLQAAEDAAFENLSEPSDLDQITDQGIPPQGQSLADYTGMYHEINSALPTNPVSSQEEFLGTNELEFFSVTNSASPSKFMASPANIGWADFAEASIEFEELAPPEQGLDQLLPEGSRIEDYAKDLAVQYGHRRKFDQKIFYALLEDFPHYQSYLAMSRLVQKGFSLEIIKDAAELKLTWQSSPDLWLVRKRTPPSAFAYCNVGISQRVYYQLSWLACASLCSVYGAENSVSLISESWKSEWISLKQPERLSVQSERNNYSYFVSFIIAKTKLGLSEFPITSTEFIDDLDETIEVQKSEGFSVNYFNNDSWFFTKQTDNTLWQDLDFQKAKISNSIEES